MARIVVIDDDQSVRILFERFLVGVGHEVLLAENGRKGLELIQGSDPDLVITDIMMPEMDGLEILMEIRKHKKSLPVIAISGGMRSIPMSFLPQARMFGARYVFEKPVPLDVLRGAINELLAEK